MQPDPMLEFIGADNDDPKVGPDILVPIGQKWSALIRTGLATEAKEELLKKYPVPGNCPLLSPPALNQELQMTLSSYAVKKDRFQVALQGQLGAALSALGKAFSISLKSEDKEVNVALGDAGRILADLHHELSITRRSFILPGLSQLSRTVATDGPVDAFLFGETFTERFKTASSLEKAGQEMVKPKEPTRGSDNAKRGDAHPRKTSLNSKPPVRKSNQKSGQQTGGYKSRNQNRYSGQDHRTNKRHSHQRH